MSVISVVGRKSTGNADFALCAVMVYRVRTYHTSGTCDEYLHTAVTLQISERKTGRLAEESPVDLPEHIEQVIQRAASAGSLI